MRGARRSTMEPRGDQRTRAMRKLQDLIGYEVDLDYVCATLRASVRRLRTRVVGAHLVTCSDESEIECVEVFQREFVEPLLPALAPEKKGPFRTSNLGGRYEWGAARIAEHHYATPESRRRAKCILIKINGHVSVTRSDDGLRFGPMDRYEAESSACGALHALLDGATQPFAKDLREALVADGHDRIATLRDDARVDPTHRFLLAAIASARLQASRALQDVRDYQAMTPTVYLIVPCVTLNRPGPDSEIVCGFYVADHRHADRDVEYYGLGDDPADYRVTFERARIRIVDEHLMRGRR